MNNGTGNESADFVNTILTMINGERASFFAFHGVSDAPPLVGDKDLAAEAKSWVEHLSKLKVIDQSNAHSQEAGVSFGETVAGPLPGS